ncbi:GNAT family N-acetyltransferase [Saccharomonospora marina]|uniref:GNAT family N-acetyltransferase n=1 Tax=Saccharomonospora marina TaxID=632569 RepID=UPI0005951EA7|nr:GNAT family N-acetyltransferase [Saccharomonospora marina]
MAEPEAVRLRRATEADGRLLLAWRNDPETRRWSHTTNEIALEDHLNWLRGVLASPARELFVAETGDGTPAGTVRFDRLDDTTWEVSITVAPQCRGRGLARRILAAGERELRDRGGGGTVLASVHEDNAASVALFRAAGYAEVRQPDSPTGRFRRLAKELEDG